MMPYFTRGASVAREPCGELVVRNGILGFCGCVATHLIIYDWRAPNFRARVCADHAPTFGAHAISLTRPPTTR